MALQIKYVATPYMVNASKLANRLIMNCINLSMEVLLFILFPELLKLFFSLFLLELKVFIDNLFLINII